MRLKVYKHLLRTVSSKSEYGSGYSYVQLPSILRRVSLKRRTILLRGISCHATQKGVRKKGLGALNPRLLQIRFETWRS